MSKDNQAPIEIGEQMMVLLTYYDKMDSIERQSVFEAYSLNRKRMVYELKNPNVLSETVIKKLSIDDY